MYKQYIYVYCLYIIDLFIFVDYQHKYYKLNLEVISATEKQVQKCELNKLQIEKQVLKPQYYPKT